MNIKKDAFGKTKIFENGLPVGEITPDQTILDRFGNSIGTYLGGNQARNKYGFIKSIEEIMRGF